ncbi:MAG: Gfo/Idh/MocA family oxidoreductase [Spirochaetales bacterium]|jgi:predicted dehydrogenase|nr:Gfo/Idh/MocA family oxidoreductase [Spirochaetales bacterium]
MAEKTRIGFIGVGSMGQMAHLKNYIINDQCEVTAIAEVRQNTGKAVAQRYGIPNCYSTAKEMLEAGGLDAVVASQQFSRHGIILEEILKYGLPVFTEKPLAASVHTGEKIAEMVKNSGTFLMLGYHKRSDPATMYAKKVIDDFKQNGELGDLTYVRIIMPAGDWIAAGFDGLVQEKDPAAELATDPPDPDLDEKGRESYISFVNYYIHQVNLLRHLLGENYRPVFADKAGLLMIGESVSGKTCALEMSPYSTQIDWQEEALVCFERGWIKISLPAPLASNRPGKVEIYKDPKSSDIPELLSPTLPWIHAMKQQAVNFIAAVKGEQPPMTDAAEALDDLRVARQYLDLVSHH